jgi:glycosyltransferase involved in cell wall biosynthesis
MSVSMLCEQLAKAGQQVMVFTTTANGTAELPVLTNKPVNIDGVSVRYFKRITKDHSHFSPQLLKALWKDVVNYDVVHIHAWWNLVSVLSCAIALVRKVPVVLSPRGTLSAYSLSNKSVGKKEIMQSLGGRKLLQKCHMHVTSGAEEKAIEQVFKPKSITCIPNFIKLAAETPTTKRETQPYLKLLFFSRIEEKKGLDILLKALPLLTVPYHLTIAGDGDKTYIESLKQLVNDTTANNISWIGFQDENKFDIFYQHDLMVLPSHNENFGNVVIESLSVGTAVLISDGVGLADYVNENNLGWVCSADTVEISNFINQMPKNRSELERIRQFAPGKILHDFNENNLVKEYTDMYTKIINV